MTTSSIATGEEIPNSETPLLNDVVPGYADYKGRPSVRSRSGCWKSASFIIAVGLAERFAYFGLSSNLVSYLTGELGQSTASASAILNAWYGTASLLPILGAFIADSFVGRFRMIVVAGVLYGAGLGCLTILASLGSHNSHESIHADQLQMIFFVISLYLVAFAQGGYSPCVQAFGANQFDEEDENEYKAKSSFFNWWNCFAVGGLVFPLLVSTYIQENVSWVLGFGILVIFMFFSLVVFLTGITTYRFPIYSNGRNPFVRISRVFVKAAKNWRAESAAVSVEEEGHQTLPHQDSFKFLNKALLSPDGWTGDENICSSIVDVEDAKSILRLFPLWCACLGYGVVFAQPMTLFTKQAATLDRHITSSFQIPAASLQQCFINTTIMICMPLYDRIFVPIARAITKKPAGISMLQRVGIGLVVSLISMLIAAFVERKRLAIAREYGLVNIATAVIPMSVWWLAPQYILGGVAFVFAMVGIQEFFYDQVPGELKSLGLSLFQSIIGIGSLISSLLVSSIQNATKGNGQGGWFADNLNRAHLDYFYWLLAGVSAFEFVLFIFFAKSYVYRRRIVPLS